MKVLFTDGSYKHTLAAVRSLGKKGVYVGVAEQSMPFLSSFSKYSKQSFTYTNPKIQRKFVYSVKKICRKHKYDVLLPIGYNTNIALSRFKDDLVPYVNLPITDYTFFKIAANKNETIKLARELGVPTPLTSFVHDINDIKNISKKLQYPAVVKGLKESGRVRYVKNAEQLLDACQYFYHIEDAYPMIQEYVQGDGYGFFALFNTGRLRAFFMHKRIKELPITGGASTMAVSVYERKLKTYGERLLKALNWHGVAMVEFKKDRNSGEFKLMEINPKFWGSLDLAIASGVDFPYLASRMAVYGDIKKVSTYKLNVRFMWPFPQDFTRTLKCPTSFPTFLKDLTDPRVKTNIDPHDLRPTSFMLISTIGKLLRYKY